jgi:hypothetical protein
MRLFEFEESPHFRSPTDVADYIQKHCSEFLYQRNSGWLYRGLDNFPPDIYIDNSPVNREPRDTDATISRIIDQKFVEVGFKALRSNSIFCYATRIEAAAYTTTNNVDDVHNIFPFNGFSFTWSSKIRDLTISKGIGRGMVAAYKKSEKYGQKLGYNFDRLVEFLPTLDWPAKTFVEEFGYTNKNFGAAMQSSNEIMIHGTCLGIKSEYFKANIVGIL